MPQQYGSGTQVVSSVNSWPAERWAAIVVIGALAMLIAIRAGFRGVNVLGARASIG